MKPVGPDLLSDDEAEDQEAVADVPRSHAVNPGHLWSSAEGQPDIQVGLKSLYQLMVAQHQEVLGRLAAQDKALSQTVKRPKKQAEPAAAPPAQAAYDTFEAKEKPRSSVSPTRATPTNARASRPVQDMDIFGLEVLEEPSVSPKLFKSFSQMERNLHNSAANAHANLLRKRFAEFGLLTPSEKKRDASWCAERIVDHPAFDLFFALAVIVNSVFIGIEVQVTLDNHPNPPGTEVQVIRYIFVGLFFIELLLRILADGLQQYWGEDWMWMLLDTVVVVTSLLEVGLDIVAYVILKDGTSDSAALAGITGFKAFRIIRITRIVKTVRILRVFRFVMAFRTLITSIFHTLQSLCWALLLLVIIMYVFAVLFTQAVNSYTLDPLSPPLSAEDTQASAQYFSSVGYTMLSLFMSVAGGVSWAEVLSPLKAIGVMWVMAFLFYISFTYFAVLNVVTAVFCQKAMDNAQNDHVAVVQSMLANKEAHLQKMSALFNQLGADEDDGIITFAMFEEKINCPAVKAYFETLGLDIWDAWSFFKLLDLDGGGAVELEEFFRGCLRLRGQARSIDLGTVMHDQRWLLRNQGQFYGFVESQLRTMLTGRKYATPEPSKTSVLRPRFSVRQTEIPEQPAL